MKTFEHLLHEIASIITNYEDETKEIIGCYIETNTDVKTIYEWDGEKFSDTNNVKITVE